MKYLFLDIDGVLNHEEWFEFLYENDIKVNDDLRWFDPECIKRVNNILEKTHAKLVVSSSWRFDDKLKDIFTRVGLPIDFDITPRRENGHRGHEIQDYLMDKFEKELNYCIIDDDNDFFGYQQSNLVRTAGTIDEVFLINRNKGTGLTNYVMNKAIEILNK